MAVESRRGKQVLDRVREIALALPEVNERLSHGTPSFFIRDKKVLANFFEDHHGDGRLGLWCAAPPGVQAELVEQEPERFFVPPYVGHRGWIGLRLDIDPDFDEVGQLLEEAYRLVAPKALVKRLDQEGRQESVRSSGPARRPRGSTRTTGPADCRTDRGE